MQKLKAAASNNIQKILENFIGTRNSELDKTTDNEKNNIHATLLVP